MIVCKGCNKEIIWAKSMETGKMIPLDVKVPVYSLVGEDIPLDVFQESNFQCQREKECYVSHFSTCPQADLFSGKNKKKSP